MPEQTQFSYYRTKQKAVDYLRDMVSHLKENPRQGVILDSVKLDFLTRFTFGELTFRRMLLPFIDAGEVSISQNEKGQELLVCSKGR